mmetsp:Transcript_52619/g.115388  ORF Transcript_52619/g.115388 Transcript_52619/m.115388 type:complete len:140 (+) Transcript_52619:38-457(+)|eukprot:CAMPEP_0204319524 /NCGR_PEP_ID=MMETSP0469-20131031/7147_1 /ASSEMBLY_ACC=CAM_ASM_000384 /TAXON_ID=2969 /ORGANISM="Oxyrrhis marina" /LENGTH=139 /DNA_ID=CAMNT_0051300711 /DNA_START=38 /DNA_END=457 /DNA_ORIENTATION=-
MANVEEFAAQGAVRVGNGGVGLGLASCLVGAITYEVTERASKTALIPAFFGAPVAGLSMVLATTQSAAVRKHVAHGAVIFSLLGTVGGVVNSVMGLAKGKSKIVVGESFAMAVILGLHVRMAVKHFKAVAKMKRDSAAQ